MSSSWEQLVTLALLGTERQPFAAPKVEGPVGNVISTIDASDQEAALLATAAVLSCYRKAGVVPHAIQAALPVSEAETTRCCSPRAGEHLARMLAGDNREVLPEYLAAVARAKLHVPHRHLPALLELARGSKHIRELVPPVVGARGRWLTSLNPAWRFAADGEADDSVWQTGNREQRLAMLRALRQSSPDRARELVASSWTSETPDDRASIVATYGINLDAADEPFLESALDDKRKEVRRTAADLLARLPSSRLSRRMLERVRSLVTVEVKEKSRLLGLGASQRKITLGVTPPEACTKEMIHDGIEPKPPAGTGEKAWWLQQMIGVVPPSVWSNSVAPPAELIAAIAKHDWREALLKGWLTGAARHQDARWAESLLTEWLLKLKARQAPDVLDDVKQVVSSLPSEVLERVVLVAIGDRDRSAFEEPTVSLLAAAKHAWSPQLSLAFRQALHEHILRFSDGYDYHLRPTVVNAFGPRIDTSTLASYQAEWPTASRAWNGWSKTIDELLALLQFRHDMLKEIQP